MACSYLAFSFFFTKLRDGKIAFLTTTPRAVRTARCVVCKEGNIWMRSCVRAVRKSVTALFSLFVFLTFSIVHFLTCSLTHFSVSHFLICSLFTSSLANFLVSHFFSCSFFHFLTGWLSHFLDFGVISNPLGVSCRMIGRLRTQQTLNLLLQSHQESVPKLGMFSK